MTGAAPPIEIDARGHRCPVPSLRLRRALEAAAPGAVLRLLTDDPLARIDAPLMLRERGDLLLGIEDGADAVLIITARKRGAEAG